MALSNKTPVQLDSVIDLTQATYSSMGLTTVWLNQVAVQINVTIAGSPTGNNNGIFKLQCSLDNVNWVDMTVPGTQTPLTTLVLNNKSINYIWQLPNISASYIKVVYTKGTHSAAGDVADIWYAAKEI